MKYITDTDFLPEYRDLHFDSYQLLYGIAINQHEGMIYDTIITLCRTYRESILRKSKVDYWKTLVDRVISRLEYIEDKADVMIYLPYRQILCTPERLIQRYTYAKLVLDNVRGLEMNQLTRRGNKSVGDIRGFYPIKKLEDLMYDAVPFLAKSHNKSEVYIKQIVANELYRRGVESLDANPSTEEENMYIKVLLNGMYLKDIQPSMESKEDKEPSYDGHTKLESVGFVYYALQYYLNEAHLSKKKDMEELLRRAVVRIINGLETPHIKLDTKNISKNTAYKYVYNKSFNSKNTNFDTLQHIVDALKNHGIKPIPEELTQALGKYGK